VRLHTGSPHHSSSATEREATFVAVEGCNGAGKSTVAAHLASVLDARLFHFPPEFIEFKEATALDLRVRAIPRFAYYLAAVLELSDLVRDALHEGSVVCDRYVPSAMMPVVAFDGLDEGALSDLIEPFAGYLAVPDLIVHLHVEPHVGVERIRQRARETGQMTALAQRLTDHPEVFADCDELIGSQARALAPTVDIDTTSLTPDVACAAAVVAVGALAGVA
jgi:thymidylate kinase